MKDKQSNPTWLPKLSLPHLGAAPEVKDKDKETIEQLQEDVRQLRHALRWSLGYIVNIALGLEVVEGAKVETAQIRQGIKEGLKGRRVPRGVLTNLEDVPAALKEWDFTTFRVEQDIEIVEKTEDRIVFKHGRCPEVFKTMRQSAQFIVDRVSTEYYLHLPSAFDFLCVPHSLCRATLISWLSDGKFEVEELSCQRSNSDEGMCLFAVKKATNPVRRSAEGARGHAAP